MSFPGPLRGNCHCGRFRFTLSANLGDVFACGCSLCRKLGCLWLRVAPDSEFTVSRDDGVLVAYEELKFCGKCGTPVMGEHQAGPLNGEVLVNARAIWGFNPFEAGIKQVVAVSEEGRALQPMDMVPGALPAKHHGSCHCGKVRVQLLAEIPGLEVKEDNCSSCVRNAYIGVYPTKDQVRVHGRENTFEYLYGRKFNGEAHCKTCGVLVFNNVYGPLISVFDSLPPERKEVVLGIYWKNMAMQPLNVRVLDNVNFESLDVNRADEGTEGYVLVD
ncbi:Mss4-like protein [Immersiella caudata]|uniref:Mss4-like protein n=1 Tax=Immersiella caudata TaxID=314043 RepID=A0AA39XHT3_9PEZI|nr:Mss4-like protein [Immersiella caudata]